MSVISDYLSALKRQYPNTQDVREQLEELRDTLHIKAEEYQSQGLNYNDAAKAAIDSLGDVTPLLEEVAGNVKNVYINRLNRNNALFCTLIILAEFLIGWFVFITLTEKSQIIMDFFYSSSALLLGICVWPAISIIQYLKQPKKAGIVEMQFKKLMWSSVIGWLIISFILFAINFWLIKTRYMWFPWPMIGIATWPINIFLYHRQLMGGRYDAA